MIKTGKKDVFVSYVSFFLRSAANIILLPIILKRLVDFEYGMWNIFVAVGSLVVLIDLGHSVIVTRYVVYAYSGAKKIEVYGAPEITCENEPNIELLFKVLKAAKKIYGKMCIISGALIFLASFYVIYINQGVLPLWKLLLSWYVYGASICIQIYYISYNCVIKGLGRVKEIGYYQIVQHTLYLLISYILLTMNLGISAVAFSNAAATVVFSLLVNGNITQLLNKHSNWKNKAFYGDNSEVKEIYEIIKKNTKGLFGATLSTYIANYGSTLVCSIFLPVATIGRLGLTNQLVGVISNVAVVPLMTYTNRLGELKISKKWEQIKDIFSVTMVIYCSTYIFGGLVLLLFGYRVLAWYGTNTQMLGTFDTFIILLTSCIVGLHQRCTAYLMFDNHQPHIKAYFVSSVATVFFSAIALAVYADVKSYIIVALIIQLLYNGWKWPMQVYYELKLSGIAMIKRTLFCIKNQFKTKLW